MSPHGRSRAITSKAATIDGDERHEQGGGNRRGSGSRWRGLARGLGRMGALGVVVAMIGGCGTVGPVTVDKVTVAAAPEVKPTAITTTIPDAKDLLAKLDLTKIQLTEALAAQKELNAQRQELAEKEARAQADLNTQAAQAKMLMDLQVATSQAEINRLTAERDQANKVANDRSDAAITQAAKDAGVARLISYAVAAIGVGGIIAGAAVAFWMGAQKIGGAMAITGLGLLFVATNLVALSRPIQIGFTAALGIIAVGLTAAVANTIYWDWRTSRQAYAQKQAVIDLIREGRMPEAAILDASARALEHVASKSYDPSVVGVSEKALALLTAPAPVAAPAGPAAVVVGGAERIGDGPGITSTATPGITP